MKYKVGDKVVFKNTIFLFNAEILEVYENNEFEDFDYYIRYKDYEGNTEDILVREKDIVGYAKGTKEYLKEEISKLIKIYSKEEILEIINSN